MKLYRVILMNSIFYMNQNKNSFIYSNGFPIGAIYKLLILISKGAPDFQALPYYIENMIVTFGENG